MPTSARSTLPLTFSALLSLTTGAFAVDFKEEVRPILNKKCFKCHTGPKAKGGLRMDSEDDFSKRIGGDDPVIIPGDPGKSLLSIKAGLPRSDGEAMPPPPARDRGAEPMTTAELGVVRQWITEGARFSSDAPAPAATSAAPTTPSPAPAGEAAGMKPEIRTWTNSAGAALQASFVSVSATHVTLKKEDGSQFDYELEKLSAESQALAKQLGGL